MMKRVFDGLIVMSLVSACFVLGACASPGGVRGPDGVRVKEERLDGYAEWRAGDMLIVDGQRVLIAPGARFKGKGDARDFGSIPLGYEVKVKGTRIEDGAILASELEARPNNVALFEKQIMSLTDEAESSFRKAGRFYTEDANGEKTTVGRLRRDGPEVERMRAIVDALLPPYIDPGGVRVYVIENDEWNAFAMGNYSIYAYSGLLRDLDDDELAIVLGHELTHASHEHTRRQFKKAMWLQIAALGVSLLAEDIDNKDARAVTQLLVMFGAMTWQNGFGRQIEDQADRVGLRYAYEAGFDVTKGPRLWRRFAKKYGETGKVANFFFGDHSLARQRAQHLENELALNYPEGRKPGGRRPSVAVRSRGGAARRVNRPSSSAASDVAHALKATSSSDDSQGEIRAGMSKADVRRLLGKPEEIATIGREEHWKYSDFSVVFEGGRVTDVEF
jgi:Zn-dependent protease with chaperone function